MSPREQTIVEMLAWYEDARAQAQSESSRGGEFDSSALVFDPFTWTREYRELERQLEILKRSKPSLYWHVSQRYLVTYCVRREVFTHKTRAGHRVPIRLKPWEEVASRATLLHGDRAEMIVRVWDRRVDPTLVQEAIRWIARSFRGMPSLPREIAA